MSNITTNIFLTWPASRPLVTITLEAFRRGYEVRSTEPSQERMTDVELLELLAMLVGGTEEEIQYGVGNIIGLLAASQ